MELDFDKEIDALLRRMPKSDADISADNPLESAAHLDADEISAFAENALPEKAKQRLTKHFAECDSCRKNLSKLILLSGENAVETAAEEKEIPVIAPALSWYRKLFAFPNLAYTMGALVLAFTALTAFIVLQNFSDGLSSEVARSSNTNSTHRPASAPVQSEEQTSATANANSAAGNTAANSNSAANISPQGSPEILSNTSAEEKAADKKQISVAATPANQTSDESDLNSAVSRQEDPPANIVTLNQPETKTKSQSPIAAESQPPPKPASVPDTRKAAPRPKQPEVLSKRSSDEKAKDDVQNKEEAQGASLSSGRQIGGKTFNRSGGVWYDSAYRNQPTTNVRRGTNEYRNLDSGLRSIGNQLGGVVVVVWKTKAYRIQ